MESQTVRNIQQNLANSPLRPIYADEIVVAQTVKAGKDTDGKTVKEGHIQVVFIDMTTQKPVNKVILSRLTAKGLHKALGESIQKLDKELKSKKIEKSKKVETDYIR
jgi:predicted RNA-binding protein with PIN domain